MNKLKLEMVSVLAAVTAMLSVVGVRVPIQEADARSRRSHCDDDRSTCSNFSQN
jgi:hypothetical protein